MKYFILTTFILIATILVAQIMIAKNTSQTNTIEYEVIAEMDGFEIRKYPSLTVASTRLNADTYSEASKSGFRKVASYIFGGNSTKTQIAMTSPVQMDMMNDPKMSFFMPNGLNVDDLPLPNRRDVFIEVQPSKTVAVIGFSGWASDHILTQKFNELKDKLTNAGIEHEDSYSYLGYNPPYQLMNRKNEIVIELNNFKQKTANNLIIQFK